MNWEQAPAQHIQHQRRQSLGIVSLWCSPCQNDEQPSSWMRVPSHRFIPLTQTQADRMQLASGCCPSGRISWIGDLSIQMSSDLVCRLEVSTALASVFYWRQPYANTCRTRCCRQKIKICESSLSHTSITPVSSSIFFCTFPGKL